MNLTYSQDAYDYAADAIAASETEACVCCGHWTHADDLSCDGVCPVCAPEFYADCGDAKRRTERKLGLR